MFLVHFKIFFFFLIFQDRVSLFSPRCPGTHAVEQAGLEPTEICLPVPPEYTRHCILFFIMCTCVSLCRNVYMAVGDGGYEGSREAAIKGNCHLPDMISGNQTQVLYNISVHL